MLAAQFLSAMAAILIGAVAGGTLADWNIAATLIVVTACGFGLCLTASIAALRAINRWTCHSRFAQARISQS